MKRIVVHRYSLAGGSLEFELPAKTPIREIRAKVFA